MNADLPASPGKKRKPKQKLGSSALTKPPAGLRKSADPSKWMRILVKQNYTDFARRLDQNEPKKRVAALRTMRLHMQARFMKLFALFRLKKYKEPLTLNLNKPSHIDFLDGTSVTDFENEEKEILTMKKKNIALGNKSDLIQKKLNSLLNRVSDKISDLHTVKEESD